ncbi:MAG: mechanosensitive ion channel family protein, partial [Spirochaetaceae bacterium]|nr:mechanosensitive ion channel family protein [Spirochaetaceae bacterium]
MDLFSDNGAIARILSSDILIRVGKAALYYLVGILIIRLTSFLTRRLTSSKVSRQSRMILNKIVTYVGMSVLLVVILAELGVNLTALLGAAGILGLAVGVASQKSLGNMVSGLFLLSEKSFEIGDVIKVGDKAGIVHDVDLLSVKMRTFDNLLVRIPNETLISTEVVNITRYPIRRMDYEFSVSMDTNLTALETLLRDSAESNPLSLEEPKPIFLLKKWDHDGIAVLFGAWFLKEDYIELKNS